MATPTQLLKRLSAEYPRAWALAEAMHRDKGKFADWPAWCFLPMDGWYAILSDRYDRDQLGLAEIRDMAALAAVGPWRYSKGIYRFAPEIYEAVYASPPKGDIPIEALKHLPAWCVYIETPPQLMGRYKWLGLDLCGFFAHLESDARTGQGELRLLVLDSSGTNHIGIIPLGPFTIAEGVGIIAAKGREVVRSHALPPEMTANIEDEEQLAADTFGLVALTLYLCADEPDIVAPALASPKGGKAKLKTSRGLAEAPKVIIYQVGETLAKQIRAAEARERGPEERAAPRPHLRRGHWHHYWIGPRQPQAGEERKLIVRFIMPMLVGG